jgi:hypothetical protein
MERRAWAHRGTSAPSSRSIDAAIGELRRLNAEVLAAAEQLKPVTIETLLARSDLEAGIEALLRGWPGTGLSSNGTGQWR